MDFYKPFLFLACADADWIASHKESLQGEFELNVFTSGSDCLSALNERQPDVLLLDTQLPGCNAWSMHREIRDDFNTSDVYQFLLCSESEAASADLAADDFMLRPAGGAPLLSKLRLLKKSLQQKQEAKAQMAYAQNVAMTAMSSMGELGVVMEFMSKSFGCRSIQAVGEQALHALEQYGLDGIVHFVWEGESYTTRSNNAEIGSSDREQIAQLRTLGRLLEIKEQLAVNFDHTTILIKNMPDDPERCGRIRDNIATLCEGIESRVAGLLLEHDNLLKQQGIRYAVCEIRDSVANLYERQLDHQQQSRELMLELIDDFETAFVHMAIRAEIENAMISELVNLRHKLDELWDKPNEVDAKLRTVVASLETLAGDVGAGRIATT